MIKRLSGNNKSTIIPWIHISLKHLLSHLLMQNQQHSEIGMTECSHPILPMGTLKQRGEVACPEPLRKSLEL